MENLNKTSNNLQGTFPTSETSLGDIIGTKVETDENGAITKYGWEKLNNALEMYSDKRYETARYLFVKDDKIVRHVAVSSKTPASTAVKPDDDFLLKLRTYAEQTDSKVIFIHNHPSGYVMPSENDINLTKYLESVFIDNGGKARFLGHAILDHGNYGLYTKKSGWAAMMDGEIKPLSDLDKNYSSDEKNYGLRIKGKEELVALAEKAKSLDSLEIWNKKDWIPAFFASASKIVKSHDYIGNNEFSNTRSLAEKLKSIGRNYNSENVYFFPSSREQQLQCEAFAQTTGLVANIVFKNEDGNFELSDYSGGTLFSDTRAKDISVEDTDSLDRSEIERKLFETAENNTNEILSTQAKKDRNMENMQTIENEEVAPDLKTHHRLKEEDVKSLEVISDEDFSDIVDSMLLNDYRNIPNVIRLPNIRADLAERLGLEKDAAFIMKNGISHIRPSRKGGYGQAFDDEEYRKIPEVMKNANFAVVDKYFKNFQIVFDDKNDEKKINKLVFNKDELGNYLVTIGKIDRRNAFSEERNEVVGVGFAPTIQTLRMGASSTRLRASPTTDNSVAQEENSVNKKNHIAANFILEKLKAANIEVIADKSEMLSILESGKLVQKMAAFHGTGGAEKSFDGYGAYVVSVNEGDARRVGMKVASKKYGDAFYVKDQTFETFLKEHKFSPYWAELLKQSRLDNAEELQAAMMLSDTKGNAELERQKNELSTLFKYGLVEHKREKAFVYSIDIPDNDGKNYLPYENPIGLENAEKINGALEKFGTQWRVTRNDGGRQVYFNTLSDKVFGGSQEEASKFLKDAGLVGMRMNDKNYIVFDEKDINVNKRVQFMTDKNGEIYGFAHGGKIYLDPDLMNANTPAHEYTHIWDAYTRQTNPGLWEKGKDIFRQTRLWNEVKGDPNYADIADDEDLVLSEVHARICGDIAQRVLERMAEQDGEIARDRAIDWDKEVAEYVAGELGAEIATPELGSENYVSDSIRHEIARNFLAQPMKDLLAGKGIALEREQEKTQENALSKEDLDYIRSPEFIEKFGDWEKAQRLEKLKAAKSLTMNSQIIVNKRDVSKEITKLRETYSRENLKSLQKYVDSIGKEILAEERKRQGLNEYENPKFKNNDTEKEFFFQSMSIREIRHHNLFQKGHIEALQRIPEIISNSVYIGKERNENGRNSDLKNFHYFGCGIKIDGEDYTCKAVFAENRHGELFYDQSLSTIEKGKFVDLVNQKNKPAAFNPQQQGWDSNELYERNLNPFDYYDKRLINICQVPQMKYLDKNLMPTKDAIEAVRAGKLHIEKNGQVETMIDENRNTQTEVVQKMTEHSVSQEENKVEQPSERIQKMATPAENANDVAPSARGLSEEQETAERLWRAAVTDYDDPIEAAEAWHNGTDEEREAISRAHAARLRNAPSGDDFVRITAESADAGLFADMRDEMGDDPLARNTPETLSVLRNIESLAAEAGSGAETGRLSKEFVASLEENGIRLYKSGQKNLLRILDIRNVASESREIPDAVPVGEAGSFFWNGHNVRTDGGKSSYDLIAEAHGTAYRRFHAKEAMRKILENGNDYELTEADTARIAAAGFRNRESLGDIGRLAEEAGKVELFQKISGVAFGREEAVEKLQAGEKVEWIEERKTEKQKEPQQEKTAQAAEQTIPEEEAEQKEVTADPRQDENSLPSQMKEMKKMMEEQNSAIRMLQEKLIQAQKENSELHQTISMLQAQGPRMDEESQAHERSHEEGRGERPNSETQHLKNIDGFSSETAFNVNQKIPKFGKFSEETKKIEINDGCVFQKYIEHPTDKSMDKILYLDPKHTRINENGEEVHTFEMSAREYQIIINASEKYEARKLDMRNDYDWLYANEEYQTALKIDHDKFRRNTAANFFHNIRVSFRASGCQNIDDAMKCARNIVAKMTPYERKRFNEQRNEYGAEKFDQMLIKHFTNNRLELTEEELARLEVERKENKDSLLEQIKDKEKEPRYLQNGETIGETKTTVGSDLKIALHMTGFDGKRIKTPIDDFKIVKVTENFRPDKAILYSKKMKSSYTIPLATLEGYIKEMEQIRGKMEKVKAKSEKVEKNLLKRKEKRLTLDTGRVGR